MMAAHRSLLLAMGTITLAMALGAWWSYAEQGWGGYWAWDPVENGSLAPWLACVAAIHSRGRSARVAAGIPWFLALGGAAVARSGAVRSVHTFADSPAVGWTLGALAIVSLVAAIVRTAGLRSPDVVDQSADSGEARSASAMLRFPRIMARAGVAVVVIGTVAPLAMRAAGQRQITVNGSFFARLTLPLAIVAIGALALLVRSDDRRRVRTAAWLAHIGFAVLLVGVVASTFDRSGSASIAEGESVTVAGLLVSNQGVSVDSGAREGTDEVRVALVVDGFVMTPGLTAYPERGGILAETALVSRPWRDVQAVLLDADDRGRALVEVRVKPFVQLVWLGAVLVATGTLGSARRRGANRRPIAALVSSAP